MSWKQRRRRIARWFESGEIEIPFVGKVSIQPSREEANAAWSLYVELATRVSTQPLAKGTGSAREALSSIHSLFEATRSVLREHGPNTVDGPDSIGPVAIRALNNGVRPFLVRWHTALSAYEDEQRIAWFDKYGGNAKPVIDENTWPLVDEFYAELESWRQKMLGYLHALAVLAGMLPEDGDMAMGSS